MDKWEIEIRKMTVKAALEGVNELNELSIAMCVVLAHLLAPIDKETRSKIFKAIEESATRKEAEFEAFQNDPEQLGQAFASFANLKAEAVIRKASK